MANTAPKKRCVTLISIDGYGVLDTVKGNAIKNANTTNMTKLSQEQLYSGHIQASGLHVGLPDGLMGNSEVGHLTIGSGRVLYQDLVRINLALKGRLDQNETLMNAFNYAKAKGSRVHLLGLISDGGVHSHIDHFKAFLAEAKKQVPTTYVHFFADGRDTPPSSAVDYLKQLQDYFKSIDYGKLATIQGRYYAMDRDKRWERVAVAYDALVDGKGEEIKNTPEEVVAAVQKRYEAKETDEFLKPMIVDREGLIRANDVMIFMNYRSDRMREIVEVFGVDSQPFVRSVPRPAHLHVVQMARYNEAWSLPVLFPPVSMDNVLAEWVAKHQLKQFHTAETEKYAHVTFFFNGGREVQFDNEFRQLVPSPKVATYDLEPAMNVRGVGQSVVEAMQKHEYSLIVCNLAPPDMVGHTGKYEAAIKAVEATDEVIGQIWAACLKNDYALVITADHGNAEEMEDEQGNPKTSHTTNPVPLIVAGQGITQDFELARTDGGLCDVAPTVLHLMGLPTPPEMTGHSMLKNKAA